MKRMVNNRLLPHLEQNGILNDSQSGYRKFRSTKIKPHTWLKKLNMLSRKKQKVLATFFDLSKAFDKIWKEGLLCKLSKCGVKGKMLTWIRDYLTRRCARVKANNTISNLVHLHEGVPQRGVLSQNSF